MRGTEAAGNGAANANAGWFLMARYARKALQSSRSSLTMELVRRALYIVTTVMVTGLLAGCFSYHREVSETTPAVSTPSASSTTTTTSTNDDGTVEHHSTTTYNAP
jgi:predicted histidine transporter YuiF (NhaC family)